MGDIVSNWLQERHSNEVGASDMIDFGASERTGVEVSQSFNTTSKGLQNESVGVLADELDSARSSDIGDAGQSESSGDEIPVDTALGV